MKKLDDLKCEIEALPHREYMKLVHWLSERDWDAWDQEIESDSAVGKLDFLIDEVAEEKRKGNLGNL